MIEASSLSSRLFTFVLAACLTTLVVLIVTLAGMFPLERAQIFFLTSRPADNQIIAIQNFDMNRGSLDTYKQQFIREYIIARNQIMPSNHVMRARWRVGGLVHSYSSLPVFQEFVRTRFWHAVMEGRHEPLTFRCDVTFDRIAPRGRTPDAETFAVTFRHICRIDDAFITPDFAGQECSKTFTMAVTVEFLPNIRWDERLDNPLGLRVIGYTTEDGGNDPLNPLGISEGCN